MRILILILTISLFPLLLFAQGPAKNSAAAPKLRPIQENGKWGYIDINGTEVVKPQFEEAREFSEGLACFEDDGRRGRIVEIFDIKSSMEGDTSRALEHNRWGFINEKGEIAIEPNFTHCENFSDGAASVSVKLFDSGYIDHSGNWVLKPNFFSADSFKDGMALVRKDIGSPFYYVDKKGNTALAAEGDSPFGNFSEGFAIASFNGNIVLIDKSGGIISTDGIIGDAGFSEGLAPAKKEDKWGYIDKSGHFVIEPNFSSASSFSEGLAAVGVDDKVGYIDRQGKMVIEPSFFQGDPFSEGLAPVYFDRLTDRDENGNLTEFYRPGGYIDKTGKVVIRIECLWLHGFIGGLASVDSGNSDEKMRGYINKEGKYVWGPKRYIIKEGFLASLLVDNRGFLPGVGLR